ncbi:MAG TPA: ATP-dependent DNA ligase [Vicinamibacterales bacterium]|nr:ATP-dependent DNA ligase [Vicinamibacterales bacterium]
MRLSELVAASGAVAAVSGRLEKIAHLAAFLGRVPPDLIPIAVPYLSGAMRQGRIGVGGALLSDLRDVPPAETPSLDLADVDAAFDRIAAASGRARAEQVRALLGRATRDEQDFLARLLFGELRQGALEGVVVEAIARAGGVDAGRVRRAAMLAGDLAPVAHALLADRDQSLSRFALRPFQPVQPMLADSAGGVREALDAIGALSVFEHKLDGARIQVHKVGDEVKVYSRNLRDVTAAVPEIVTVTRAMPGRALVLDGEAIAMRPDGRPRPFQETMRRFGRRLDVRRLQEALPIAPFFFDALYVDGDPLIDEPLVRRAGVLDAHVTAANRVSRIVTANADEAAHFAAQAVAAGHEGVMAKAADGVYAAGRRGQAWLKVKQARTLDLVVLAAEWGSGRRRGTLSNIHLGARDPEHGGFVMLGKTFKGMTDAMLAWQTEAFLAREIGRDSRTVFVRPEIVAEIAFNEIQDSSQYPGGVALRFARVKRYRSDKTAAEADTIATVLAMK